jgi:hypothetical protein
MLPFFFPIPLPCLPFPQKFIDRRDIKSAIDDASRLNTSFFFHCVCVHCCM